MFFSAPYKTEKRRFCCALRGQTDPRNVLKINCLLFVSARKKKLRFHPRQLYPAAKQGEVQRVLLMLSEWQAHLSSRTQWCLDRHKSFMLAAFFFSVPQLPSTLDHIKT